MVAAFQTRMADSDIIVAVDVPKLSAAARYGYYKFCRKTGEFPDASAAAVFDPESGAARLYVGALSGPPQALDGLAAKLARQGASAATEAAIAEAVAQSPGRNLASGGCAARWSRARSSRSRAMTTVAMTLNGARSSPTSSPKPSRRLLRDSQRLSGTHLGCEHGVCGACTVLLNGAPARSCITLRWRARHGSTTTKASTTTTSWRAARSLHQGAGLQCGLYARMLIAARDIVLRLPTADSARFVKSSRAICVAARLCRIVNAVASVPARATSAAARFPRRPASYRRAGPATFALSHRQAKTPRRISADGRQDIAPATARDESPRLGWTASNRVSSFASPARASGALGDIPRVAPCLPGRKSCLRRWCRKRPHDHQTRPIAASFAGSA